MTPEQAGALEKSVADAKALEEQLNKIYDIGLKVGDALVSAFGGRFADALTTDIQDVEKIAKAFDWLEQKAEIRCILRSPFNWGSQLHDVPDRTGLAL